MPVDLLALADRIEQAVGPSRELDRLIGEATDAEMGWTGDVVGLGYARFTESIDAAITRIPEGISYELVWSAAGDGACRRARLWDWRRSPPASDPGNRWESTAKTLPLAICAAALRARANAGDPR